MPFLQFHFPRLKSVTKFLLFVLLLISCLSNCSLDSPPTDSWGPLVVLRDDSRAWPEGKPHGGWWVTPVHANLLPNGNVLITGWGRRDKFHCQKGGTRKKGLSFILDPSKLVGPSFEISPIDEQGISKSDVLYCSGHGYLPDGKILFSGGAGYKDLGLPTEIEWGLNYARIFQQQTNSFSRIDEPMLGGPKGSKGARWYPTVTTLPDFRHLITGGFVQCCGKHYKNLSIEVFDYRNFSNGAAPWKLLVSHDQAPDETRPGNYDYPHVLVLPWPVPLQDGQKGSYQISMMGKGGRVMLFNYLESVPSSERFARPVKGQRSDGADGATSALLSTGEIFVMGGSDDPDTARRGDVYNPYTDSWYSTDMGIVRDHPSSVLLPDGTVLVVNGGGKLDFKGDRRQPQTFNPITREVKTWPHWPNDLGERGYHNIAILLKDGRVLIGGGLDGSKSQIWCERPDVRIYSPAYLNNGPRPEFKKISEPVAMEIGGEPFTFSYSNGPLKSNHGVVLMGLGSTTHSFDQHQRFVPLDYEVNDSGTVTARPPRTPNQAPPGDYFLFLVNQKGVPSEGKHVILHGRQEN